MKFSLSILILLSNTIMSVSVDGLLTPPAAGGEETLESL